MAVAERSRCGSTRRGLRRPIRTRRGCSLLACPCRGRPEPAFGISGLGGLGPWLDGVQRAGARSALVLDQLSFAVLATGSDGCAALINHGEISPDFDNRGILLATTDDDKTLPHPRSGLPGDVKGGR
jgi:hypothetical protein